MAELFDMDHSDLTGSESGYIHDPFSSPGPAHQRYSEFNSQLFALNSNITPDRAKRALEAHLAETERRIQDASKLGTTLVQQQKDLADKLKELDMQHGGSDITPELRQKLADIEKEYNDVGRDAARTFMPRSRVASGELGAGSPYGGEPKRSISPSKFESQATSSPSKLNVPNRKNRNQPANRVHDIEFATEISTSLLSQVRNLQALLAEKEENLKVVELEKSRLEIEAEGFSERLRSLDESENRYKDENWNLETQIHEYIATTKEAADREKRLTQSLNILQAEKTATQKELDDIKLSHAKLVEDHTMVVKHHDAELGSVKRNMVMVENERGALQRKVDDLSGQNQELVKAVAQQHIQLKEQAQTRGFNDDSLQVVGDGDSPEGSPPPSPIKGTPRHSMLESETLKSSLQHAHRMIQNLKGNIHREKTEKLELKRMLQDARDELDVRRSELALSNSARKSRKQESKDSFKKPALKPSQLGSFRRSKSEISMIDETNWVDDHEVEASPTRSTHRNTVIAPLEESSTDHFETANETEAFETANERGTETEDFQTGAEELTGSDDLTETEEIAGGVARSKKTSNMSLRHRASYESTASLSGNEFGYEDVRTPSQSNQRLRSKASRISNRRSRFDSAETMRSSPASFANSSRDGTPQTVGQSLFAELGNMDDSEQDDADGTPSRGTSYRGSATPVSRPGTAKTASSSRPGTAKYNRPFPTEFLPPLPRPAMVDSSMMTDDWQPTPGQTESTASSMPHMTEAIGAMATGYYLGKDKDSSKSEHLQASRQWNEEDALSDTTARPRPISASSVYSDRSEQHEIITDEKLSRFPSPPASPSPNRGAANVFRSALPPLTMSTMMSEHLEPVSPAAPPPLKISSMMSEHFEPVYLVPAPLEMSKIQSAHSEPIAPTAAPLDISSIMSEGWEPVSPVRDPLAMSTIQTEKSEPISPTPVPLGLSLIRSEYSEPISPTPAPLRLSLIRSEHSEPVAAIIPLTMSNVLSEHSEPIFVEDSKRDVEAAPILAPLAMSKILSEHSEPILAEDQQRNIAPIIAPWAMSSILSEQSEPVEAEEKVVPAPVLAPLAISSILSEQSEPVEPEEKTAPTPIPAPLVMSTILSEQSEPVEIEEKVVPVPVLAPLAMSAIAFEQSEPVEVEEKFIPAPIPAPLTMSEISFEQSEPVEVEEKFVPTPVLAPLTMSTITFEQSKPVEVAQSRIPAPTRTAPPIPFSFSSIRTIGTEPVEPPRLRSPKRDGFIFVRNSTSDERPATPSPAQPETPKAGFMGSVFGWGKNKTPSTPIIAEDATRQSPSQSLEAETPESQKPFKEISTNTDVRTNKKQRIETADESSQTALTADQIDDMLKDKSKRQEAIIAEDKTSPVVSRGALGGHTRGRRSQDSISSLNRVRPKTSDSDYFGDATPTKRPTSAGSNRGSISSTHPPLPSDHKKVIAAAAQRVGSSSGGVGSMGPPPLPASALRAQQGLRPRTPTTAQNPLNPVSVKGGTTPRPRTEVYSPTGSRSRASSVTSFASELDSRFNMQNNGLIMPQGIEPGTDPRMIQAITQTMIGEYLWKYTRKAGRGEQSENRHRRYFWVHPYTRTLYWSDRDPSQNGKSQAKAKSVAIEAVRVVTDDNPMPPGLHRKSLVIITPGRTVKFTAPTGQRHETWFNALSYLLLRTAEGAEDTAAVVEGSLTQQDIDEFNPQPSIRSARRAPPSRSSYNSQATYNTTASPASVSVRQALNPPQLHQSPSRPSPRAVQSGTGSTFSRLSTLWKPSETGAVFSSRRSRASQSGSIYAGESEAHDSAEDLRKMIEKQDREADRLENVRACCDGKHDVGSLNRGGSRQASHNHSHRNGRQSPAGISAVAE